MVLFLGDENVLILIMVIVAQPHGKKKSLNPKAVWNLEGFA